HSARAGDLLRALLAGHPRAGDRRGLGPEEDRPAQRRHPADAYPPVRGLAGGGRDPGRGAHLRAGSRPGADRRAPQHDRGQGRSVSMASATTERSLFDWPIIREATVDSFRKLAPQTQVRNPVMFVVYVGSILTTLLWLQALGGKGEAPAGFIFAVSIWLWFTVL